MLCCTSHDLVRDILQILLNPQIENRKSNIFELDFIRCHKKVQINNKQF